MPEVRTDKWLWAVRIFKTRTIALEECKKGRVEVNDSVAKPSRMLRQGDIVKVRKPPVTYTYRVLNLTENRVGAALTTSYLENITPAEELEILELTKISGFVARAKGTGRPTKKERRELDRFSYDNNENIY